MAARVDFSFNDSDHCLMNSFRIGVIGVLVDRFGQEQAEGFFTRF